MGDDENISWLLEEDLKNDFDEELDFTSQREESFGLFHHQNSFEDFFFLHQQRDLVS